MDIDWENGSRTVRWRGHVDVEKDFPSPPSSVVVAPDHSGVLVVEAIEGNIAQPSNAVVFNEDGAERLRLKAPLLPETSWQIGYYLAYADEAGRIIAVYSTRVGDLWGTPDWETGELLEVHPWR